MDWIAKLDALSDGERALITKIAKTWLAKGEDVSVVGRMVRSWLNKTNGDDAGSKTQDQRDPTQELEDLVNAHMAAHRVKRTAAYSRVLASRPDLNAALAKQRDVRLRKVAQACGDGYGR